MTRSTRFIRRAAAVAALGAAPFLTGCSTAGEGAVSGAGIGALTGLVLGSMVGDAGEGALIGTAGGAVIGGVIGDQNERNARYSREQAGAIRDVARARQYDRHYDRPAERHGWDDRYDDRYEDRYDDRRERYEDRRGATYEYEYERYERRSSTPRVIIRYDTRPKVWRHSYSRYGKPYYSSSSIRWGWGYRDPYCR